MTGYEMKLYINPPYLHIFHVPFIQISSYNLFFFSSLYKYYRCTKRFKTNVNLLDWKMSPWCCRGARKDYCCNHQDCPVLIPVLLLTMCSYWKYIRHSTAWLSSCVMIYSYVPIIIWLSIVGRRWKSFLGFSLLMAMSTVKPELKCKWNFWRI